MNSPAVNENLSTCLSTPRGQHVKNAVRTVALISVLTVVAAGVTVLMTTYSRHIKIEPAALRAITGPSLAEYLVGHGGTTTSAAGATTTP